VEVEEAGGHPLAVGVRQVVEEGFQVERGVAEPDVAGPADRAAVADHAVYLEPRLDALRAVASPEAQGEPVVREGGGMQPVASIEGRLVGLAGGGGLVPELRRIPIGLLAPGRLQVAGRGERL